MTCLEVYLGGCLEEDSRGLGALGRFGEVGLVRLKRR